MPGCERIAARHFALRLRIDADQRRHDGFRPAPDDEHWFGKQSL
jgi:hypothetical protein